MQRSNLAGPIIVAIGVVIAAMAFAVVTSLLRTADQGAELRLKRLEAEVAAAEAAREDLRGQIAALTSDLAHLRDELSLVANRSAPPVPPESTPFATLPPDEDFEHPPAEALTEEVKLARSRFNSGVTQPRNRTMLQLFGQPRETYGTDCQPVTNPKLRALIETRQVGPITVSMIRPALDSLQRVLDRLKQSDPDIHAKVGTAGALCARLIRGSASSISNHSWGTAIDLKLEGVLDPFADGQTHAGLLYLAEYFREEGWFWGAAYSREDSMHFEVGEETLRKWLAEGRI
ncbi:M15 family metallopeptidase [Rhodobacter sp. NSM]|uniref:M15 family metallopeptidase n=1 Tax=Rhodobacter sp. NSM TaxID=3457501 RepID=UPI003FD65E9A